MPSSLPAGASPGELANPHYVKSGVVLEDFDGFDADFFGFSPKEAAIMDPQHRQFLECAWEALEDAGHVPESFEGSIGVFGGCGMGAVSRVQPAHQPRAGRFGGPLSLAPHRQRQGLLGHARVVLPEPAGPSMSVQTACSTSLVAAHLACQSLLSRRMRHGACGRRDDRDPAPARLHLPAGRDPLARRSLPRVRPSLGGDDLRQRRGHRGASTAVRCARATATSFTRSSRARR